MTNNEPNVKLTIGSITQLTEHGIEQTTDAFGEITKNFVKVQAQHMDAALRAKLIELGWTPPGGIALNTTGVDAQGKEGRRIVLGKALFDLDSGRAIAIDDFHWPNSAGFVNAWLVRATQDAQPHSTGVYAAKLNELVNKWRGIAKSYEIKADRKGQSDDMRDWYQGVGVAIGNCASELSAALAALADGKEEHDRKWANYGTPVDETKVANVEGEKGNG